MRIFFLSCILVVLFSCQSETPDAPKVQPEQSIEQALDALAREHKLMGMSVQVVCRDNTTLAYSFGSSDVERKNRITEKSIYRVASISKSFSATALMQLYEKGAFKLDEDVSPYLGFSLRNPAYPDTPITFRMLLSHTSSVQDGDGYFQFSRVMRTERLPITELFGAEGEYIGKDLFQNKEPGSYFKYTNAAWGLVASLVEKISGKRFDLYCQENIFQPLGMDASFNVELLQDISLLTPLYRFQGGTWAAQVDDYNGVAPSPEDMSWYQPGFNGLWYGPQGSLRCSPSDLAKFMSVFLNYNKDNSPTILQDSTIDLMLSPVWDIREGEGDSYGNFMRSWGLGMQRIIRGAKADIVFPDRDMFGHPGEAYGLISDMFFDPITGVGVIFMTNGSRESFASGKESTFYQLEEDVFKTLFQYELACTAL